MPVSDQQLTLPEPHPSFRTMDVSSPEEKLGRAPCSLQSLIRESHLLRKRMEGPSSPLLRADGSMLRVQHVLPEALEMQICTTPPCHSRLTESLLLPTWHHHGQACCTERATSFSDPWSLNPHNGCPGTLSTFQVQAVAVTISWLCTPTMQILPSSDCSENTPFPPSTLASKKFWSVNLGNRSQKAKSQLIFVAEERADCFCLSPSLPRACPSPALFTPPALCGQGKKILVFGLFCLANEEHAKQ